MTLTRDFAIKQSLIDLLEAIEETFRRYIFVGDWEFVTLALSTTRGARAARNFHFTRAWGTSTVRMQREIQATARASTCRGRRRHELGHSAPRGQALEICPSS